MKGKKPHKNSAFKRRVKQLKTTYELLTFHLTMKMFRGSSYKKELCSFLCPNFFCIYEPKGMGIQHDRDA